MDLGFNGVLLSSCCCVRVLDFSPNCYNLVGQGCFRVSASDLLVLLLLVLGFVDSRKKITAFKQGRICRVIAEKC